MTIHLISISISKSIPVGKEEPYVAHVIDDVIEALVVQINKLLDLYVGDDDSQCEEHGYNFLIIE